MDPVPHHSTIEHGYSCATTESTRIPFDTEFSPILETPLAPNPIGASASRSFRFCVPDEWYRRSKSRTVSSTSNVSQDTIRRLADLEEEEGDDEDELDQEGTAKLKSLEASTTSEPGSGGFKAPMDWRGSISQNRFSSILDSWIRPQSPVNERPSTPTPKVVSEPKLVEHKTGDSVSSTTNPEHASVDADAFEQMLVRTKHEFHYT